MVFAENKPPILVVVSWFGVPSSSGPKPRQRGTPKPNHVQIDPLSRFYSVTTFGSVALSVRDDE